MELIGIGEAGAKGGDSEPVRGGVPGAKGGDADPVRGGVRGAKDDEVGDGDGTRCEKQFWRRALTASLFCCTVVLVSPESEWVSSCCVVMVGTELGVTESLEPFLLAVRFERRGMSKEKK